MSLKSDLKALRRRADLEAAVTRFTVGERVVVSVASDRVGRWNSYALAILNGRRGAIEDVQVTERMTGTPLQEPKYLVRLDEPVKLWEHASETSGFWFEEPEVIRE